MNPQKGISLLEVIAALVILSIGATVAFTWLGQSASSMHRLKEEENILLVKFEAIEYIRSINAIKTPQGQVKILDYYIQWESMASSPIQRSLNKLGSEGFFEVGLFKIKVSILKDNIEITKFSIYSSGYNRISNEKSGISW